MGGKVWCQTRAEKEQPFRGLGSEWSGEVKFKFKFILIMTIPANGYYYVSSTVHGISHFFLPTVDMYQYIPLHRDV